MKIRQLLILVSATLWMPVMAQQSKINYEVEAQAIGTTNEVVPFWMRSNQFGSIPSHGVSGSFIGRAHRDYDRDKEGIFDWGAGFEGRANAGNNSKLLLIEGYAKVKAGIFQLKAGRTKDVIGLTGDTSLTSGNFAVSGNALGVPKIEISIPDYYRLPILRGLVSFKGTFSHGWLGSLRIRDTIGTAVFSKIQNPNTYLHQKALYGRFGKENWKLQLYGGFNHQVFWGSEREIYGERFDLSDVESFMYVVTGKAYGNTKNGIPRSKLGNQLGSIDVGAEYKFPNVQLFIYRQNFYDIGALSKLANIADGLNGLALTNLRYQSSKRFDWQKLLLEFFYSKNQAGELSSKTTKSGDEDYYNNYFYRQGWSYKGQSLGSPFISTKNSVRENLPSIPNEYFINNRVVAFHLGFLGRAFNMDVLSKFSYSINYGTYGTSLIGHSGTTHTPTPEYGIFEATPQFSGYIDVRKKFATDIYGSMSIAIDKGNLLYDSGGVALKLVKAF